jgi:pyridoxal phosphate enzyme (YggS family)
MSVSCQYKNVIQNISCFPQARLVAVVKNQPLSRIQECISSGAEIIAFNRVQEAEEKIPHLIFSGKIHYIGRLQRNKVKKAVRLFHMIESVDSFHLAEKISLEAKKMEKHMEVLCQVNIACDRNKTGFSPDEIRKNIVHISSLPFLYVRGLMAIGKKGASQEETRRDFQALHFLYKELRPKIGKEFREISMGMSEDYHIALEEGATIVRVGKLLFSSSY